MNVDKQKRRDLLDRAAGDLAASQNDVRKWSPETVREHALKWAATQDLVIPDASPIVAGRTLAPGESALYLYREDGFWDYPVMALPPEVRVDGAVIVWLRNGGYLPVVLAPGVYTVTVDSFPRQSMKPAGESTVTSLKVQTLPGQAQYVTVRIPQLTLHPHWTPVLTVRSEAEALPALKQVKPVPTTMSPHTPPKTPKDFRQYETVKLVVADEVQTPYSQEGVPLFEAFLKGRLQYLGYAVGDADSDRATAALSHKPRRGMRSERLVFGVCDTPWHKWGAAHRRTGLSVPHPSTLSAQAVSLSVWSPSKGVESAIVTEPAQTTDRFQTRRLTWSIIRPISLLRLKG